MWPFKRREPPKPRFAIGDPVFFQIIPHGQTFAGTVRAVEPGRRLPYVVECDGIGTFAETDETLTRSRPPQECSGADQG